MHVADLTTLTLGSGLFKLEPSLVEKFPFCEDMKFQAYSTLYCGSFPHIESNTWTVVLQLVHTLSFSISNTDSYCVWIAGELFTCLKPSS